MTSRAMDSWKAGFLLNISAVKAMRNLRAMMTRIQYQKSGRKW